MFEVISHTFDTRTLIAKEARKLPLPTPLSLLPLLQHAHPLPHLTLDRAHPAALLAALDVVRDHVRSPLDPPLRARLCDPVHSFYRPAAPTALHLRVALRMPRARLEDLPYLLHAHVRREGWAVACEDGSVALGVIVLVLWELGPETAENAVADAWDEGCRRPFWSGVESPEHELGGLHLGDVLVEELLPWRGWERRSCGRGGGHCA